MKNKAIKACLRFEFMMFCRNFIHPAAGGRALLRSGSASGRLSAGRPHGAPGRPGRGDRVGYARSAGGGGVQYQSFATRINQRVSRP